MNATRTQRMHQFRAPTVQALERRIAMLGLAVGQQGGNVLTVRRDGLWRPDGFFATILYEVPLSITVGVWSSRRGPAPSGALDTHA